VLVTSFQILPNASGIGFNSDQIDGLITEFFEFRFLQPVSSITAKLYDGHNLLGTHTVDLTQGGFPYNFFASPSSPLMWSAPTRISFASLQNRTIDGRVEVTIDSGTLDFETQFYRVGVGNTTGGGLTFYPWVRQTSQVVPEPSANHWFIFVGLVGVTFIGRSRVPLASCQC
jgi:hypothetical protein